MKILTTIEMMQLLSKTLKKPSIYLSFHFVDNDSDFLDMYKAAPYLNSTHIKFFNYGEAIIICEDEKEQDLLYNQTVGDDGPTKLNPYDGEKAKVYALTCDKNGILRTENT